MKLHVAMYRIFGWLAFLGLYLLMAGKADLSECVTGAVSATAILFLVGVLRQKFKKPLLMEPRWFLLLWRIPVATCYETWQLLTALVRRLLGQEVEGRFLECDYPPHHDREESARRAYMTFGVCITPNSYLVHYDEQKNRALIRQLVGEELSTVDRLFVELQ